MMTGIIYGGVLGELLYLKSPLKNELHCLKPCCWSNLLLLLDHTDRCIKVIGTVAARARHQACVWYLVLDLNKNRSRPGMMTLPSGAVFSFFSVISTHVTWVTASVLALAEEQTAAPVLQRGILLSSRAADNDQVQNCPVTCGAA